jgi:DnaJ-class molecular chaperone
VVELVDTKDLKSNLANLTQQLGEVQMQELKVEKKTCPKCKGNGYIHTGKNRLSPKYWLEVENCRLCESQGELEIIHLRQAS